MHNNDVELIWEALSSSQYAGTMASLMSTPCEFTIEISYTPDMDYDGNEISRVEGNLFKGDEFLERLYGSELEDAIDKLESECPDNIIDRDSQNAIAGRTTY